MMSRWGGAGSGWGTDPDRPRVKMENALDTAAREEAYRKHKTLGDKARLKVNKALQQPGGNAAIKRAERAVKLNQRAAMQEGLTRKEAQKLYPTIKDSRKANSSGCFFVLLIMAAGSGGLMEGIAKGVFHAKGLM